MLAELWGTSLFTENSHVMDQKENKSCRLRLQSKAPKALQQSTPVKWFIPTDHLKNIGSSDTYLHTLLVSHKSCGSYIHRTLLISSSLYSQAAPLGLDTVWPSVLTALGWLSCVLWGVRPWLTNMPRTQTHKSTPHTWKQQCSLGYTKQPSHPFPQMSNHTSNFNLTSHKYTGAHTGLETTF